MTSSIAVLAETIRKAMERCRERCLCSVCGCAETCEACKRAQQRAAEDYVAAFSRTDEVIPWTE